MNIELKEMFSEMNIKLVKILEDDDDDCKHSRKEEDDGTVFCIDCGLVFEDETVFKRAHYISYDEPHKPSEMIEKEGKPAKSVKPTKPKVPKTASDQKPSESKAPRTASDLKKLAKERGIKYYSRMTKKELCKVLEITSLASKPTKIVFTNKETGEEQAFKSLYQASKEMKVNPGLISYYNDNNKEMKIGESTYTIKRL